MKPSIATILTGLAVSAGTTHGQVIEWNNPSGGSWSTPGNWNPMAVPAGPFHLASVSLPGMYTVTLDASIPGLGSLSLTNPDATLAIAGGRLLGVQAGIENDGLILVNPTNVGADTRIVFNTPGAILTGAGILRLAGTGANAQLTTGLGMSVTNGTDHTIAGFGQISADMTNEGVIDADVPGQTLLIRYDASFDVSFRNPGRMVASAGVLEVGQYLSQHPGGELIADGGMISVKGNRITEGTLDTRHGGEIWIDGSTQLDGVTNLGQVRIAPGQWVSLVDGLVNHGTVVINPSAATTITTLDNPTDNTISGDGQLVLNGDYSSARITGSNTLLYHEAPHTIRGYGLIDLTLVNRSVISADVPGRTLHVQRAENSGTIEARNGGILRLYSRVLQDQQSGSILADGGDVLLGSNVSRGTLDLVGNGTMSTNGVTTLVGVTNNAAPLAVPAGNELHASEGLTNNGEIVINPTGSSLGASLIFDDTSSLSGMGRITLAGGGATIGAAGPQTILHAPPHVIGGFGSISAAIRNDSLIVADAASRDLVIHSDEMVNNGEVLVINQASLIFDGTTVTQGLNGVLRVDNGYLSLYQGVTVVGGTISVVNGGGLYTDDTRLEYVTLDGFIRYSSQTPLFVSGALTTNGTLVMSDQRNRLLLADGTELRGNGEIVLGENHLHQAARIAGMEPGDSAIHIVGHTISGVGEIAIAMTNSGRIAPGMPVGTMLASAPITCTSMAELSIEIAGENTADLLESSSTYHAAGTLTVVYADGFDPAGAWDATIVTAEGGVTGRFDTIVAPRPIDPRLAIRARYLPNAIHVGAVCTADLDLDGLLNFFDLAAYIDTYNAQAPAADLAEPFGAFDIFDVQAYLALYSAGCP